VLDSKVMALACVTVLLVCSIVNNVGEFNRASGYFLENGDEQNLVRAHMRSRPTDPWPRGEGHVLLGLPGTSEQQKGYHEPGGSFSPGVRSFGVSLWIRDENGQVKVTSDDIPLPKIKQAFLSFDTQEAPGIVTDTPFYQTQWSVMGEGYWKLHITPKGLNDYTIDMLIRSSGPAGGPIDSLIWDGQKLLINDRWKMIIEPLPQDVHLGDELNKDGWDEESQSDSHWESDNGRGWGFGKLQLVDNEAVTVHIHDTTIQHAPEISTPFESKLTVKINDEHFPKSLNAQIHHLVMSAVDTQTRPGDPLHYPFASLREGAYVVVALARAGQLRLAKVLSHDFTIHDFFGGFGSEADAPGLSLWALEEVASRLKNEKFDQRIWPHVKRKAELILEMVETGKDLYKPFHGKVFPHLIKKQYKKFALVAGPAHQGLIMGKVYHQDPVSVRKVDHSKPILYVNAVSYLGLQSAIKVAKRLNHIVEINQWRSEALKLKKAWQSGFKPPGSIHDMTYSSSLWPSWVADSIGEQIRHNLEKRWNQARNQSGEFRQTPSRTYLDIAEAHQWIFLQRPDRVVKTLDWFWRHQASPGLYTWWERNTKDYPSSKWKTVRGWVNPPYVTPHYWSAAEMLLLQLDVLLYVKESGLEQLWVIGGGVPNEWLLHPIHIEGLTIPEGRLAWHWDGKKVDVIIRGKEVTHSVRLGPSFPKNTPLNIAYL